MAAKNNAANPKKDAAKKQKAPTEKTKKKNAAKKNRHWGLRVGAVLVVGLILGISLIWRNDLDRALGLVQETEGAYDGTQAGDIVVQGAGGDLNVHFIDVGQGDSCVVELPDGRTMLIDAGPKKSKDQLLTYLNDTFVKNKSADDKLTKFDFAILTHSDEDHCGGFPDVLSVYSVGAFYRPNELSAKSPYIDPDKAQITGTGQKTTAIYQKTIAAAHEKSDSVTVLYAPDLDKANADKIVPEDTAEDEDGYYEVVFFGPYGHSYTNLNDYSPVIIIEYAGKRIALSGDAEAKAEAEFVQNATDKTIAKFARFTADYTVNVLKLGHHGSETSSSENYLSTLTNATSRSGVLIIISCGYGNKYGHPRPKVLERLTALGFTDDHILRTDQLSHIVLSVRGADGNLVFGATSYTVEEPLVDEALNWMTLAITVFVLFTAVVLLQPMLSAAGIKNKNSGKKTKKK